MTSPTKTHPGNIDNMVEVGKFAKVKDDFLKEHGINEGETIYVAGDIVVPVDGKDPYNLRRLFVAAHVDKDGHIRPNEGAFTIDGLRLDLVDDKEQGRLDEIKHDDFAEGSDE